MAHLSKPSVLLLPQSFPGEKPSYLVTVLETGAGSSDTTDFIPVPIKGTIRGYEATLESGSGSTLNPSIGRTSDFVANTQDHVATSTLTPAIHLSDQTPLRYYAPEGKLYFRSGVNSGSDNTITTEVLITEGWED